MPKLITNVEGNKIMVHEMRIQMAQILARLKGEATVTFHFRMTIEDYTPRPDAKS
jgi:hypothetical protein